MGKTYFGLTVYEGLNRVETSTLANYAAGTTTSITIERGGNFEFAGAFRDDSTYTGSGSVEMDSRYTMMPSLLIGQYTQYSAADRQDSASTLKVIYNGGGRMEMTGVYTLLTGNSGFEVASGIVSLHGTNTIHAIGSDSGKDLNRWQNTNDWHYAMAEMNVKVGSGSSFELGDHALLIGNVQVEAGGSFVMKQAVNERHEYVEGWYKAEDTYALSDYYGLKGNVKLAAGASMNVTYDAGVATQLRYGGNISGQGSLSVDVGEGSAFFSGKNTFSGEKTLISGNLRLAAGAEGNTAHNKWKVEENASLALDSVSTNAALEARVDASSTGVLALSQDFAEQVSLGGLIVGAAAGETIHYGSTGASLQASGSRWTLGGGGGTLMVDFKLEGANKLVLGNAYGAGIVVLTNEANSFSGGIETVGKVTLGYTNAGALGNNVLTIGYGKTIAAVHGAEFAADKINAASDGIFATTGGEQAYDLSLHGSLSLGAWGEATYAGRLMVAEGAAYRLGGSGVLTIGTALSGAHGILIDGQGTTGSGVIFAAASADTGALVVQGYDAAKANEGDVTLSFTTDNALAAASSVTLHNGAGVDLNGTNQSFHNLTGTADSLIHDDKGGNILTFNNSESSTLSSLVQAAGTDVVKSGSGTLVLMGDKLWKSLSIQGGVVQVADGKSLGYLASGSQGIDVSVSSGAMLHVTAGTSFDNTLNIAGYGADGASVALKADGHLNNAAGTLNVVGDAAISGQFTFKQLNLGGNELTVQGSGSSLSASSVSAGSLKLSDGALNWDTNKGGGDVALELDNGTVNVAGGSFAGTLTVGAHGGTVYYPWNNNSKDAFSFNGCVSGSAAGSTLKLVGYKHTINLAGGVELAGALEVGNGLTLNITKDASVGALLNQPDVGDESLVVVDAARLTLTGSGSNFGSNGNPGTLELTNGAQLQLAGLAGGGSMGALGSLNMGTNGEILLSSLAGYGSGEAMMHIGTLSGTGRLLLDASELNTLGEGTYHLLTSGSQLTDVLSLADGFVGGRRELNLTSTALADGSYALDLTVGAGVAAQTTWQGTGTLVAGAANTANITSSVGDSTFMAMDSLSISSDAGANDTLTLSGDIFAASVTYTGAGRVTLAQQNGGAFAKGQDVVVDGTGTLALGDTQAISGEIELKQGTLSASSTSLNATEGMRVTGDAAFELTSASHVTVGMDIEKGKNLTVSFKDGSMADEWGGNLDDNLSGSGKLVVNLGTGTKGTGNELHLNGNHMAFTGEIEVQSGTLQLGLNENGKLLSSSIGAKSISVAQGATLALCSTAATLAVDIDWADGATLQVKDGVNNAVAYTLSGTQTLGGTLNIVNTKGRVMHISGKMTGAGSLHFVSGGEGTASILLSGNNSYSGGTIIDRSDLTVYAAHRYAFGTGTITLKSGTLSWAGTLYSDLWQMGDLAASSIELCGGAIDTNGYDVLLGCRIIGSESTFTKTGAGTLELTQSYTHSGQTHVQAGTLALRLGKTSWYAGFSGEKGATLRLNSHTSGTALRREGLLSGGLGVELDGDFDFMSNNTHTGGTSLRRGSLTLVHSEALGSGALRAAAGTTVSVCASGVVVAGNSVVDNLSFEFGSLSIGTATDAGQLSFNKLSGTATPTFLLDIFSAESYDRLSGTLTPGSLLAVNLMASELGSYLLVEGDNRGVDTSAFTYSGSTNSEHIYLWSSSERGITLRIEDKSLVSESNVWAAGNIGTWDASSAPWYGGSYSADKKTLVIAPDDTAISVAAVVSTTALEAEVEAGATLSFSPKNGGSITAATLQKDGAGTLSFASGMSNSFSSVVVNEGMLSISAANGNPLGTTTISGNGTFELTGGSLRADLNAGAMAVKNIRLDGGALTLHSTAYWGTAISGRSIDIVGENSSLTLEKWANLNASTVLLRDGGSLYTGNNGLGNDGGTIYVAGSGSIKAGNAGAGNIAAAISGTGTLTITDWYSDQINLRGAVTDAEGGILGLVLNKQNLHIGNIVDDNGNITAYTTNTYSGGTSILGGSVTTEKESALGLGAVTMSGGTLTLAANLNIGSLSGTAGSIELGGNTLHINQVGSGAFAGNISGTGAVTKTGMGTLTLSGTNSVASINLLAGRLVAASDGALSSGTVTFSAGTSLYVANNAKVSATLAGGNYLIGAEAGQAGSFTGNAAASLLASGFTKEGDGKVTVTNSAGQNPAGGMVVNAGTLAYDAGSSSTLGAVSGSGTFTLVGGAVNASSINVGKLVLDKSVLAYSSTFDGKVLEVSGKGSELRMGHWASVNNSTLLLKDGGRLSMSSSGFNNSTVTVEGSGILAVGETASWDKNPILDVESSISGSGTLYVTDYSDTRVYTVNVNKAIADSSKGALALSTDQSDLHFTVANTYSGGTTINGGKLTAEVTGALGSGAVTINDGELVAKAAGSIGSGDVTMNGGKLTLDLGTEAQTFNIGNLSGTGGVVDIGQNTFVINQTTNGRYDGSFSGTGYATVLKRGDATLELGGALATYGLQLDSGTVKLVDSDALTNDKNMSSSVVTLMGGTFDINGQTTYKNNALLFDVESGYIAFRGDEDMLVKDSSGATSGLGFYTAHEATAVRYYGTGRAEISANIVNGGQASPSHRMEFKVNSAGKGAAFTELTISGNIGADHSADERYKFGISKTGAGTMLLSGDNGYSGGTIVAAGTLIAGSNSALGSGYVEIASGATLEIAAGTQVSGLTHGILFQENSELKLHSLSTDVAALTTTGAEVGGNQPNWSGVVNVMTLTLAEDIQLEDLRGYKVLSLGSHARDDMDTDRVSVNYLGDGRFTFSTRYENSTLYLDVTQDAAASLVWGGTAESGTWNQSSQNENWNTAGDTQGSNSFMNQDSVSFTEAAANKTVAVAESGVQVDKMTVSGAGADYSFSGGAVKAESVSVEQGASMNMGTVYTVGQQAAENAASMGKVEMGSDADSQMGYIHGAVAGELSALDNVVIDIAKGATLELKDILLTDSSRITDDPATVAVENVTIALSEANAILQGASTLNIGTELVPTGGGASFVLTEETSIVSVFSSALDTVNVTGTSLTIDLSGLATNLGTAWQANQYVAISFGQTQDSLAHFDLTSGLSISATYGGSSYSVYVNKAEQASAATLYVSTASDAIPEPTTTTLSLLALSLLAARRRRK